LTNQFPATGGELQTVNPKGRIPHLIKKLFSIVPDKTDLFLLLGIGFLVYGIFLVCPPAACITFGLICISLGVLQWYLARPVSLPAEESEVE
jgi:hypothetical protein